MLSWFAPAPAPRDCLTAALLAALCSLLLLGAGVLPTRAVVPFVPERYEPARSEAEVAGTLDPARLALGTATLGDKYNQSLAWDRITQDRLRAGSLPTWSRALGGGAPFVPQMGQVYQPWNLLLLIPGLPSAGVYGLWLLIHHVLLGLGAFWFLRRIGASNAAALVGVVLVVLGLWTQARTHHNVILTAALPLFPVLTLLGTGLDALGRGQRFGAGRIAALGLLLGSSWSAGFAPVALQVTTIAVGWAVLLVATGVAGPRRLAALAPVTGSLALGALLSAAQMIPTLLAASRTSRPQRSPEHLCARGLDTEHLWTALWPDLLHLPTAPDTAPTWWSLAHLDLTTARDFNWPETAFALGLPAVLGLVAWLCLRPPGDPPRSQRLAITLAAVLLPFALSLAMGIRPVVEAVALIPGTTVGDLKRSLFTVAMAAIPLAVLGLDRLAVAGSTPRRIAAAVLLVGVAAPSLWLLGPPLTLDDPEFVAQQVEAIAANPHAADFTREQIEAAMWSRSDELPRNRAVQLATFGRAALVALGATVALALLQGRMLLAVLAALSAAELAHVGRGLVVPVAVEQVTTPARTLGPALEATRAADATRLPRPRFARLEEVDPGGFLDLLPPNLAAYHGLEDAFAYHPLPSARFEELYAALEPGTWIVTGGAGTIGLFREETLRSPWLDLLGIEFVLAEERALPAGGRFVDVSPPGSPTNVRMWRRAPGGTWPRATFVTRMAVEPDVDARLARLAHASAEELRDTVILEDRNAPRLTTTPGATAPATVRVVEHLAEQVTIDVETSTPGYLRLADPYDPGWRATLDDQPAPVFAADHRLRAVHVPAPGRHRIVFRYDAPEVWLPRVLSLLGLAIAALLAVFGLRQRNPTATPR